MYRIGELAKLADVTPDTIRYYEKQQMMDHDVRTEGGFRLYRITIFSGCVLFAMPVSLVYA
jgi:MerR family Zn(II)-responsive transcriptional regulator of zntA